MADPWPIRALSLAASIPRSRLHSAVVAWADARPARETWAVAFSGGADSLALLLLVWAHWPKRRARLRALHFNHRLRGAAARADARFCAEVGRALGLAVVSGSWAGRRSSASEAEARAARFAFFEKELGSRRIRALFFGHQQDDVAESMMMRLSRGSGSAGLAAPRPMQRGPGGRVHLRPLLTLKKSEIVAALRSAEIPWREDASNATDDFFRNRIRRDVLPAWVRAAGRDALAGAANARELLDEDDAALEAWVDALAPVTPQGRLNLDRLAGRPQAVARRALRRWLAGETGPRLRFAPPRQAGELSRQGFASLLAAVQRGCATRQSLGVKGFAVIRGKWLVYEEKRH